MIELPPFDAGLPGLGAALDGDAMARILGDALSDRAEGRDAVVSCQPRYVRYKPGTNCVVRYDLHLRDAMGETAEWPAHVHLYADDRASRRWRKAKLQHLVETARLLHPAPLGRAAYLPELQALACLFPVDYNLPALARAASTDAMRALVTPMLPREAGRLGDGPPALVRYKPARKALLRLPLAGGAWDSVYAKALTDDRGSYVVAAGRTLLNAGVATAMPLGYVPEDRLLVHAAAPGGPLSDVVDGYEAARWMEPTAAVLTGLHRTEVTGLPDHRLADEATTLHAVARSLGALLPPLAARIERLATALGDALTDVPEESLTLHGDFYTDQVLVSESGVVLIDLDEIRRGHPLLDVGMFLGHLTATGADESSLGEARASFEEAYLRRRPGAANDVALFEAAALLRKAPGPFRRLEPEWPRGIERIVALAEGCLARGSAGHPIPVAGAFGGDSAIVDPALPQLDRLMDRAAMTSELRGVLDGESIAIHEIDVVRHKPGRRCLLRYDLEISGKRQRLYGKTFASQRGPRVHEITRTIAEARAFGPDVLLPEPVGFIPHLKLLLQREAPGEAIGSRLLAGETMVAKRMAEALHALHDSDLDLRRRHTLDDELKPLETRVEQIAECAPALATAARRCLERVQSYRPENGDWRWRPCHRDCYHDQFLIGRNGLAVLDLDDAAMSEPAVDVANVLAHLRLFGLQERDDACALDAVATAFRDTSCRLDHALNPDLLRYLEGATLLRLAAIHVPRARGIWLAQCLLDRAQSLLPAHDTAHPV